jgi:hypothetical protein
VRVADLARLALGRALAAGDADPQLAEVARAAVRVHQTWGARGVGLVVRRRLRRQVGPRRGWCRGPGPARISDDEEVVPSLSWATSPCEQATSASAAAEWSSGFRVTAIAPHGAPGARKQRTVFESR